MAKDNKLLFYFALILLALSIFAFILNVSRLTGITGQITGSINLSVETLTQINFTTAVINWSSGAVGAGKANATLDTSAGSVTNGNWTAIASGLVLENIGNVNVSLDLAATKNSTTLLDGTSPNYKWNISNVETGSCIIGAGIVNSTFWNVNTSANVCSNFSFANGKDSIEIDFQLVIPSDSKTGVITDIITATATAT